MHHQPVCTIGDIHVKNLNIQRYLGTNFLVINKESLALTSGISSENHKQREIGSQE